MVELKSLVEEHELSSEMKGLLGERCRLSEPLARRSSLRIGGSASWWIEPHTQDELINAVKLAARYDKPVYMVGLGSNTLFPDEGIDGVVVRLQGEFASWKVLESLPDGQELVNVGAGCVNAHLVRGLLKQGYVGAEFLMLIPGCFGGAVVMNAGTRDAELGAILEHVTMLDTRTCEVLRLHRDELDVAYRHTSLPEGALVMSAEIRVHKGDVDAARTRAQDDKERRNRTQPYKLASVGSTFANPEGDYAGRLIEAVGLKGNVCGGAQVSELHANFFINQDNATARDFLTLMARARVRVREQFDTELRPEVQFVGFDGWSELARLEALESQLSNVSEDM